MVRSSFAAGSALQELYISHDRMKPEFRSVLRRPQIEPKRNETVLKDVNWISGSPMNLEVHGFASWSIGKGIIALRNPSFESPRFSLDLRKQLELTQGFSVFSFAIKSEWKDNEWDQLLTLKDTGNNHQTKSI